MENNGLQKDLSAKYFAKRTEKWKFLNNSMDKEVEKLDDHGCHKNQELVDSDKQMWIAPATHSHTKLHFSVQSQRQNCLLSGQCST